MNVDVAFLPGELEPGQLSGKAAVVFDVLRATTTMTAALSVGVKEIGVFSELDAALAAGRAAQVPHLICGERRAVKPPGFDLGNSPEVFNEKEHRGLTLFMATTNGTRAIVAAGGGKAIFVAALVNAAAVAEALLETRLDVTLLCAGTEGEVSLEDVVGAGAVIDELSARAEVQLSSDRARIAHGLFCGGRGRLADLLTSSRGGQNIIRAGLTPDIAFCARLNVFPVVGAVRGTPPVVSLWEKRE